MAFLFRCLPSLVDRHDNLFQGGVARALANAVDGALDLPRARHCSGQAVGRRQAQIILPRTAKSLTGLENNALGLRARGSLVSLLDCIGYPSLTAHSFWCTKSKQDWS